MVSLDEGKELLREKVVDDYNTIINVYNFGTKEDAVTLNPKMDRTIKKASIGIQRHSMTFGGKEYIKWVKDSYLMMGMAHFYKQDYTSARRVFDYVAKEYESSPIHYDAILWLARTYIQTERYEKAEASLNLLQSKFDELDFPRSVEKEIPVVYADFYISKENYNAAYSYLERGIELSSDKYIVTRMNFILGQINQAENNFNKATDYFEKVVKRNPPYKMAFEAQMNIANCYDEGSGDSKHINKVLLKMARETKNKEYLDQIYYALAQIAISDKKDTLVVHYLKKSVSTSVSDPVQKTTSSLELADIFFEIGSYEDAQAYYDTAAMSLPKDYPNYDAIVGKTTVLSQLVTQVQLIKLQDSLQRLARMDTTVLFAMVDNLIEEYESEQERIAEEKERGEGTQFVDISRSRTSQPLGGGWYFDNTAALGRGRTEFIKKWGDRKLEDNWRLSDKRSVMQSFEDEEDITDEEGIAKSDSTIVLVTNPRDRQYYLQHIPRTEEQLVVSDSLMIDAYNLLSYLYYEELKDTVVALDTYLAFQNKYPDNKYRLDSWYALYKIYKGMGNIDDANFYANLIISKYPESNYAKVIEDPDFFIKLSQQQNAAGKLYEKTYKSFNREQYYRVITYSDQATELYPEDTALIPKFLYLRAISLGAVDVVDTLYSSLQSLVKEYPLSSVSSLASSVIKTLQIEYGFGVPVGDSSSISVANEQSIYKFNPAEMHLVMIVVQSEEINISALKIRISDFDKKYFRLKRLRVKSLMLDDQHTIITIGNFDSKDEAGNYLLALKNDEYVVSGLQNKDFSVYSISSSNYPLFYREKDIVSYSKFYEEKYNRD
jgi:tetratricopeptide (TPR) repeat protein